MYCVVAGRGAVVGLEGPEKAVVGPSAGGWAGTQSVINNTARERERESRVVTVNR